MGIAARQQHKLQCRWQMIEQKGQLLQVGKRVLATYAKFPSFGVLDLAAGPWYTPVTLHASPRRGNTMTAPAYNFGLLTISGERLL